MKIKYEKQSLSSKFYNFCIKILCESKKTENIDIVDKQLKKVKFINRGIKLKRYGFKRDKIADMDIFYYNGDLKNINKKYLDNSFVFNVNDGLVERK